MSTNHNAIFCWQFLIYYLGLLILICLNRRSQWDLHFETYLGNFLEVCGWIYIQKHCHTCCTISFTKNSIYDKRGFEEPQAGSRLSTHQPKHRTMCPKIAKWLVHIAWATWCNCRCKTHNCHLSNLVGSPMMLTHLLHANFMHQTENYFLCGEKNFRSCVQFGNMFSLCGW